MKANELSHSLAEYTPPEDLEALENEIASLSAHINAATYRMLRCIRAFDEHEGYAVQGCKSTAHWLNWRIGLGEGAAREKVRVARALASLPEISEAFSKAEVSYSKVRAMTRIATPEIEHDLLDIAKTGTAAHVEKLVRAYRGATCADEIDKAKEQRQNRCLRTYFDEDGMLVIEGRLTPECGAMVQKALDAAQEQLKKGRSPDAEEGFAEMRADALGHVASEALTHQTACEGKSSSDRHMVVMHVSAETLAKSELPDHECPPGDAVLAVGHGQNVSAETARRIACDCSLVPLVVDSNGTPLDVGRRRRVVSSALKQALFARDGACCRFPGCQNRIVQSHHLRHWGNLGETKLPNLLNLCSFHHFLVHEGGFTIKGHVENPQFYAPNSSTPIAPCGEVPKLTHDAVAALIKEHVHLGLHITPLTGFPTWEGEVMDYDWAVMGLLR